MVKGSKLSMFGAQRLQKIREMVIEQQYVDVQNLSQVIGVSEVTVRRDLDKLQKEGLILKTYGGAALNKDYLLREKNKPEVEAEDKETASDGEEKDNELISRIAIKMIKDDEAIFLAGGSICHQIAKRLEPESSLMVITNDVFIASTLVNRENVKVVVTGGNLLDRSPVLVGSYVLQMLENTYVNKAFIEIDGVHLKFGYSMKNYEEVEIIKKLMECSSETIALAQSSRFNTTKFTKLGDLNMFKKVISNKEVPENYKKYYYDHYIKLFTSFEIE